MKLSQNRIERGYQEAGTIARAIVAKRAGIVGGLGVILGELVRDGLIGDGLSDQVTRWATVCFGVLGVVTGALWAQSGTTPADPALNPTDRYGNRLVSELAVGPHPGAEPVVADTSALDAANAIHPMADAPAESSVTALAMAATAS